MDPNLSNIQFVKRSGNSICHKLYNRSIGFLKKRNYRYYQRDFHTHILPNFSIIDVDKPPCFLRKFSPDGIHFVAFSSDQASIEIFEFQGPDACADLLKDCEGDLLDESNTFVDYASVKAQVFDRFFKLKHTVVVTRANQNLNRECSLFTDDSKYLIVGSASAQHDPDAPYSETHRNNTTAYHDTRALETYCIYVIDLKYGILCDHRKYEHDRIILSHNQGIYLYGCTLALLSVQHQTIHLLEVNDDGSLRELLQIGRYCMDDDAFYHRLADETEAGYQYLKEKKGRVPPYKRTQPGFERSLNSIKQRILTYLYRQSQAESKKQLYRFYSHFDQFEELMMWKIQLVDERTLMIKFGTEDIVTLREEDPSSHSSFFILYDIYSTQVLGVWENSSVELLDFIESHVDQFRNVLTSPGFDNINSARSNTHSKQIQDRFKQTIINAKRGGHTESVKRMLAQYPISAQSFSSSPYLDLMLFSYDNKWVSVLERPKTCGDQPIKFFGRRDGLLKYKLHTGSSTDRILPASRKLVAFTFHPRMPFAISVQRKHSSQYIVNLHVRYVPS